MSEEHLNYISCFDIIGPIMIGPSSSHTAGACAIGRSVHELFGELPKNISVTYYESFAETHRGHGTDYALIAGILGMSACDERVPKSLEMAEDLGIHIDWYESKEESPAHHANTALVTVNDGKQHELTVLGISIGGGAIELCLINDNGLEIEPKYTTNLIVLQANGEIDEEAIHQRLHQCDIDAINGQITFCDNRQMMVLNTSRRLTEEEFHHLTQGLALTHKMMLV